MTQTNKIFFALTLLCALPATVLAAAMQSSNYKIEGDSVNFGGTENSASPSYKLSDTMGEVATGNSSSPSYNLYAGYRQMAGAYITLSNPGDVAMAPDIHGFFGGTSSSSIPWTVTTDSANGYTLSVRASTNPALVSGGDSFANYTLAGANPDFAWNIASNAAEFGFTPEGTHIVQKYQDSGGVCNVAGSDTAFACWNALTTTDEVISQGASSNMPGGTLTTVKIRAESAPAPGHNQPAGTYTATITATALAI